MISEICSEIERIFCCKNISTSDDEQEIPLRHTNKFWSSFRNDEMHHYLDFKDHTDRKTNNSPNLPTEIIIKIISNLNDIEDFRSCMLLCKNIRDSIFKTPEIMRKILINLNNTESSKFLDLRGNCIRCLKIQNFNEVEDEEKLKIILSKVPNLEELTFKSGRINDRFSRQSSKITQDLDANNNIAESSNVKDPAELLNLKVLEIRSSNFEIFLKSTKNVRNLEKFTIYLAELSHDENITDFTAQQRYLKELNVINISHLLTLDIPVHVLCSKATFKLKSLKMIRIKFDEILGIFLESQLETLEELELTEVDSQDTLEILFKKSKKLRKLSLGAVACSWIFSSDFPDLQMGSLEFYEDRNSKGVELEKIYGRFPNLRSLKCLQLISNDGVFDQIVTLELFVLDCLKLQNLKLKSLKNMTIVKISKFSNEKIWEKFTKNTEKIENLRIKHVEDPNNIPGILKYLKNYKNLQNFKLKQASYYDDYEISIETDKKVVKTLRSAVEKNQEILKVLHENYDGFEFFEFKSFVGKIKKFDIIVQLDKH